MRQPAWLLAWRSVWDRPRRTLLLLGGYGIGVGVMIALLSVSEALLTQARDRDLVAGGDLVLLPVGVDPAVLKTNGVTDLDFTIQQATFLYHEILGGPRFGPDVLAAAPQIDARQVYVRSRGEVRAAIASAGFPSLDQATHATAAVPGASDTAADRAWIAPSPAAFLDRLDRFHEPPAAVRRAWAEWDYFNFVDPATGVYGYLTILAGGEGRGAVLLRLRRPGHASDDLVLRAAIRRGDLSFTSASQRVGPARVWNDSGRYRIMVSDPALHADLRLAPDPRSYLPPAEVAAGGGVSGYVVPVVHGWMDGQIRTARTAIRLAHVPAYHDHNWGTWGGVTWEWGEAGGAGGAVLYGGLHVAGKDAATAIGRPPVLFVWEAQRPDGGSAPGFLGAFAVQGIRYAGWHPGPIVSGRHVSVPGAVTVEGEAGPDRVRLEIKVRDALASLAAQASPAGPSADGRNRIPRLVFLQLRGDAQFHGTVDGRSVAFSGNAAAETFVPWER